MSLKPDKRADETMKVIHRQLLETMRANESGIRMDIDIEFLHDFRIAVRRTRSALNQVKKVFPKEMTTRFKNDFRWLGRLSNDLRDLDVYLLAESNYQDMLPEAMREDVKPLFDYLRLRRAQALQEMVDNLDSQAYATLLTGWEAFLNKPIPEVDAAANAVAPIIDLARKRIYRKYRRIIEDGTYILTHTEDELLHALRLECKRLRYLLEFFASLFPTKNVARLIKQLKRLQDNLGDFTDLSVQQAYLMRLAKELPANDAESRGALMTTGFLVATLGERQQSVKADFAQTFNTFASLANQDQYHKLFAAKGKRRSL
jgi:CHAD domain-containing protein